MLKFVKDVKMSSLKVIRVVGNLSLADLCGCHAKRRSAGGNGLQDQLNSQSVDVCSGNNKLCVLVPNSFSEFVCSFWCSFTRDQCYKTAKIFPPQCMRESFLVYTLNKVFKENSWSY